MDSPTCSFRSLQTGVVDTEAFDTMSHLWHSGAVPGLLRWGRCLLCHCSVAITCSALARTASVLDGGCVRRRDAGVRDTLCQRGQQLRIVARRVALRGAPQIAWRMPSRPQARGCFLRNPIGVSCHWDAATAARRLPSSLLLQLTRG